MSHAIWSPFVIFNFDLELILALWTGHRSRYAPVYLLKEGISSIFNPRAEGYISINFLFFLSFPKELNKTSKQDLYAKQYIKPRIRTPNNTSNHAPA